MMNLEKPVKKTDDEKKKLKIEKIKQKRIEKMQIAKQKPFVKKKVVKKRKPRKVHTKSWYVKKLDIVFSKYIRLRDKRCQRCGSEENLQNSHVVPRGNYALRWNEINCKALCIKCHIYYWHKDVLDARDWFANTFPDRVKYLQEHRNDTAKYTLEDYITMYQDLKLKVERLENDQ
jgi:5-methylcytosine-specific restriction endonuclease McrA